MSSLEGIDQRGSLSRGNYANPKVGKGSFEYESEPTASARASGMGMARLTSCESESSAIGKLLLIQHKKELLKGKQALKKEQHQTSSHLMLGQGGVEESGPNNLQGILNIVFLDPLSILLIAWPLGCAAYYCEWSEACQFWFNFLAMIPLAKIMGDATEELAAGLKNDTVGGLLNATFGNAVEMILTVQTLRAGELDVVKGTLLGSILSNLLLVLGMSFFAGGLTRVEGKVMGKEQQFSKEAALTNMTMLFLAASAFALPTVLFSASEMNAYAEEDKHQVTLKVSRWCSVYILVAYAAFLLFQLYTHVDVFEKEADGEEETTQLTPCAAMFLLFIATCFVAASCEWMVCAINDFVISSGIGKAFIGIVLLPIVGNACEHVGSVRMAMVEKVDITIGIAIGSSTQVALFVVPASVVIGWMIGQPMDLDFGSMKTTVMIFAILITFSIITDGASNWLEGFMLMIAYAIVATLFWFVPEEKLD